MPIVFLLCVMMMNWVCELTHDAKNDLLDLPKTIQKRVARALHEMQHDPFRGDVKALRGNEWKVFSDDALATTAFSSYRTRNTTS